MCEKCTFGFSSCSRCVCDNGGSVGRRHCCGWVGTGSMQYTGSAQGTIPTFTRNKRSTIPTFTRNKRSTIPTFTRNKRGTIPTFIRNKRGIGDAFGGARWGGILAISDDYQCGQRREG